MLHFHLGNIYKVNMPTFSIEYNDLPTCMLHCNDLGITVNNFRTPCDHVTQICCTAFQRTSL